MALLVAALARYIARIAFRDIAYRLRLARVLL